ncbi:unnamed protein product [Rotaria sordida]|uniref:Uncharacterized protein n=1 Tax=Rotaria sordida TaxID=392033 RepID=A0A815Y920_9BILA|nr:unnamed protein product [Rotaria sordida]CAF1566834.1 unnamed protein product [Rotaria sordida]
MSEEQCESIEMDNDPNTCNITFTQKKRRAVGVSPTTKIQDKGISMSNQPKQTDQDIRDKLIVEDLCKFAKDKHQFNIDVPGYRRTSTTSTHEEYKILLSVKNIETFAFLLDEKIWPQELCGLKYKLICPSIPPQLSAIMPDLLLNINF